MATINSAFDQLNGLSVDEMLANPSFLPEIFKESFNGEEALRLFFRDVTVNSNVIAYREATATYLEDEVENVAEYGEIPVSDPTAGEWLTKPIEKSGIGIRVSWEQRNDNDADAVLRELTARRNTLLRKDARDGLAALDAAPIQELQVATPWNNGGNASADLLDAQELILGAEDEEGHYYEYIPNVLWANPMTLTVIKRDPEMLKLYIGDMASQNPLFKAIADQPLLFGQIQLVSDFSVPKGTLYLGNEGVTGARAQREERQITDFYAERGESTLGGANMSYRSDAVHRRNFIIDNPKSVVKITGAVV